MCLTRYMAYLFWSFSDIPKLLSGLTQAIPKLGDKELREEGACEIWEIFWRCGVEIGSKLISKRNGFLYCNITFDFMKYSHHLFQQFLETYYKQSFRKFLCPRLFRKIMLCYPFNFFRGCSLKGAWKIAHSNQIWALKILIGGYSTIYTSIMFSPTLSSFAKLFASCLIKTFP